MSETFFLRHKNTEVEIDPADAEQIKLSIENLIVFLTPGEADTLAGMLVDAAAGTDYKDYDYKEPVEEANYGYLEEESYGERW
jgi:hypothetical protein